MELKHHEMTEFAREHKLSLDALSDKLQELGMNKRMTRIIYLKSCRS